MPGIHRRRARLVLGVLLGLAPLSGVALARAGARPNLTVSTPSSPPTLAEGNGFTARVTVQNSGRGTVRSSRVGFYLSRDRRLGRGDAALGSVSLRRLAKGGKLTVSKRLAVPRGLSSGSYRLLACADPLGRLRETSERDNCRASRSLAMMPAASPGAAAPAPAGLPGGTLSQPTDSAAAGTSTTTAPTDFQAPTVAIASPSAGSTTGDQTPTLAGSAGAGSGDSTTVTVRIYSGSSATGSPLQTLAGVRTSTGEWSVSASRLPVGTYTAQAEQSDAAGNTGRSDPRTFSVPGVLMAAGDIASCDQNGDTQTAALLSANPADAIAALGDNVYELGSTSDFTDCYGPTWGAFKSITHPVVGNHEYVEHSDNDAASYFAYFGSAAGVAEKGWYSYDLGSWHVVVLNTSDQCWPVSCAAGSEQELWLEADLAAHPAQCTLAMWHHPLFTSDGLAAAGASPQVKPFWDDLYAAGADLVVNGHSHIYERFAPQSPTGLANPGGGIREIIAGTGGYTEHVLSSTPAVNSEVRNNDTFGVLRLVLGDGSYSWSFLPVTGRTFTDSGTTSCHS